ncbi:probable crossover junction endonuclease EME2 [Xenopus laevis]|uniref:ERCC4 domain-containing protein n=2 Tax=Xenopus laevis TaxID=8355 RepID=A0A974C0K0_XENLA|nr:probable crossover junction endonuclease EME2 [Xenopus laevis]XP_018092008.1 probable crossover junction endonuclease EME2 [Xenopus laevis]OCT64312.1 hypothetical protein XELAEV_18045415mg [Xenopus laevis]
METLQEREKSRTSPGSSPRRSVRRAATWEISDSDNEEETNEPKIESQKGPIVNIEAADHLLGVREDPAQEPNVEEKASNLVLPPPAATTPSPTKRTRKKKSPEQVEAELAQAEEKKRQRELKRQEKAEKKELEKVEREKRKETNLALKPLRPDQCGKYMVVKLDAGLLEDGGSEDVLEALRLAEYNYSIEPHSVPRSITWKREMPVNWTCIEGVDLKEEEEDQMLVLVEPKSFLSSVYAYAQASDYYCAGNEMEEIPGSLFSIPANSQDKKVTLVVMGLHEYRWCEKLSRQIQRQSLDPVEGHHSNRDQSATRATQRQIQEALVFLQLYCNTEVLCLDTWKELGQHVCAVTKSIAQRPFRKHWEAQTFSFCTSAGSWRGWGPRGELTGLPLTWRRQIQQLNRVSPAMAAAVTTAYPSPQLLMQAYSACGSDRERTSLLSDLRIPHDSKTGVTQKAEDPREGTDIGQEGPGRERRVGPDLSRRIWLLMTTENPELVLDLNS